MHRTSVRALMLTTCLLGLGFVNTAWSQDKDWPSRSIELVSHRTAGSTFAGARIIADALQPVLGVPVVVIPKPAGAGSAAPASVATAKPDGYTLLVANSGTNGTMPAILPVSYKNADFRYLAMYGTQSMVLVVKAGAPWKTVQELAADAKKNPGKLNYSTSSVGAQSHFVMEMFKLAAGGLKIEQIPFKGAPESVVALLGGHVDVASTYLADVKGIVDAGTLRILAVPEEKRLDAYPNVPTFAESGYPDVVSTAWFGIAAPAGIPKNVADRLQTALQAVTSDPDVKKRLIKIGYTPVYRDADVFTKFVMDQEAVFRRIAKEAAITIN